MLSVAATSARFTHCIRQCFLIIFESFYQDHPHFTLAGIGCREIAVRRGGDREVIAGFGEIYAGIRDREVFTIDGFDLPARGEGA